jgi:hypothetical protein
MVICSSDGQFVQRDEAQYDEEVARKRCGKYEEDLRDGGGR